MKTVGLTPELSCKGLGISVAPPGATFNSHPLSASAIVMWQRTGLWQRIVAKKLPEFPRREDRHRRLLPDIEEITISSDEHRRLARDRGGQDPAIGRIPNEQIAGCAGLRDDGNGSEHGIDRVKAIGRELELGGERAAKFNHYDFAEYQIVLGEDRANDVRAEAAGGERGDKDIGVQADAHRRVYETASKISSSVR